MSPYVKKSRREILDINPTFATTPGDLAYVLFKTLIGYKNKHNEEFYIHNEIIGVMDCVKEEYRRRFLNEYEDRKIRESGDIG